MAEAALALSEQKNQSLGERLSRLEAEKEDEREKQSRRRKKEEEVGQKTPAAGGVCSRWLSAVTTRSVQDSSLGLIQYI